MNNKKKNAIIFAMTVGAVAATVCIQLKNAYFRRQKKEREQQIKELVFSIESVLGDIEVTDFESFAERLNEYYNINAINMNVGEIIYKSPKFSGQISSNEIFLSCLADDEQGYNLTDLNAAFADNRQFRDKAENKG